MDGPRNASKRTADALQQRQTVLDSAMHLLALRCQVLGELEAAARADERLVGVGVDLAE